MEPPAPHAPPEPGTDPEADTVDLDLARALAPPAVDHAPRAADQAPQTGDHAPRPAAGGAPPPRAAAGSGASPVLGAPDLLDQLASWPAAATPCGMFQWVPVRLERDLPLVTAWMNDPAAAGFREPAGYRGPAGSAEATAAYLRARLDGDGRCVPCLGVLNGTPMSYWEIYRADLDPLARYHPVRPHDTGVHVLIGGVADRGRGLGTALLRAAADLILDHRPSCRRVLALPDLRNIPAVAAFLGAGFRFSAEVDLPDRRAALMLRDRR